MARSVNAVWFANCRHRSGSERARACRRTRPSDRAAGSQTPEGKVLRIDGMRNPKTRLLDADIAVPTGSVMSGAAYRADITTAELSGWIVPQDAILNDDKGSYLYQVAGTKPSRVPVTRVGSAGTDDVVHGSLDPRLPVMVEGNYQITGDTVVRMTSAMTFARFIAHDRISGQDRDAADAFLLVAT